MSRGRELTGSATQAVIRDRKECIQAIAGVTYLDKMYQDLAALKEGFQCKI